MMSPLQKRLYDLKTEILEKEKRSAGIAQLAMTMQLQVIDVMFQFLASQQTEEDMGKLKLTLAKQAMPADVIKPRQDNEELTEALIEISQDLKKAWKEEVKRAEEEGETPKDLVFPLDNLPKEMKFKSVSSKIYGLRKAGKLPPNILPSTRTEKYKETVKDLKTGEATEITKRREVLYVGWFKNFPPVEVTEE